MLTQSFTISSNFQPPITAIALTLDHTPAAALGKIRSNIFRKITPAGNLHDSLLGLLSFMAETLSHYRTRSSPLAAIAAEDGRYRLFFAGAYVGGLWSADEVKKAEAAAPQSFEELIGILDLIARDPPRS